MSPARIEVDGNTVGYLGPEQDDLLLFDNPETVVLYSGDNFMQSVAKVYQSGNGVVAEEFIPTEGKSLNTSVTIFEDLELFKGPIVRSIIQKFITVIRE